MAKCLLAAMDKIVEKHEKEDPLAIRQDEPESIAHLYAALESELAQLEGYRPTKKAIDGILVLDEPETPVFEYKVGVNGFLRGDAVGNFRLTLGGDKGYDTKGFVKELRKNKVTPHVAQNTTNRSSAIDGKTTHHPGYSISQKIRKRIEECFGWMKTIGQIRQTMYQGLEKVGWQFSLHAAAYNLVRMRNLGLGMA